MNRAPLTPVPCARRTEPSAWLCPPPGKRRMPDGVDLHHTDVAARLASTAAQPGANVAPLFPTQQWSTRPCA